MTANNCERCRYGDSGSNPEGCSETCFEPDYPDFDPEPAISDKPPRCKKSDTDWLKGKTCSPCDRCETGHEEAT